MFFPTLKQIRREMEEVLNIGDGSVKKIEDLRKEIRNLTEEKETLKFKKEMEEKEIAHLVKMKEEKIRIETEKKEIGLIKEFQQKEMRLQTEYFDKVMEAVKEGQKKMETIYSEILNRLPNINYAIKRKE